MQVNTLIYNFLDWSEGIKRNTRAKERQQNRLTQANAERQTDGQTYRQGTNTHTHTITNTEKKRDKNDNKINGH